MRCPTRLEELVIMTGHGLSILTGMTVQCNADDEDEDEDDDFEVVRGEGNWGGLFVLLERSVSRE